MNVRAIYEASDAAATTALYKRLEELGPVGVIALNLLRAQKASARAKVYRGGAPGRGSYRGMAYDKKDWAIGQLVAALERAGDMLGFRWGWKEDPAMQPDAPHRWVLYIDLPTGQASFHNGHRKEGPNYAGEWDGVQDASPDRIVKWAQFLVDNPLAAQPVRMEFNAAILDARPVGRAFICSRCEHDFTRHDRDGKCRVCAGIFLEHGQDAAGDTPCREAGQPRMYRRTDIERHSDGLTRALDAYAAPLDCVCPHGRAMDVHCCGCHSGFLFPGQPCTCELDTAAQLDLSLDVANPQEG